MVKTQIQLEDWQYAALKKETGSMGRSMSDFIRQAVTEALGKSRSQIPLSEVAGKYTPQSTNDLKPHDEAWAESIR